MFSLLNFFKKFQKRVLVLSGDDVKPGVLASRDESGMERRFTVEAKTFSLFDEGVSDSSGGKEERLLRAYFEWIGEERLGWLRWWKRRRGRQCWWTSTSLRAKVESRCR
jgi:hypothetical protein